MTPTHSPRDPAALEARINAMQALYERFHDDLQTLRTMREQLPAVLARKQELQDFMTDDWLNCHDQATAQKIQANASKDHYSVLGEDTLWDALQQAHTDTLDIVKQLVASL